MIVFTSIFPEYNVSRVALIKNDFSMVNYKFSYSNLILALDKLDSFIEQGYLGK